MSVSLARGGTLDFVSGHVGWYFPAAGAGDQALLTTDGGRRWTARRIPLDGR